MQLEEVFARGVFGALGADVLQRLEPILLLEFLAQRHREVEHRVDAVSAVRVDPLEHLLGTIGCLTRLFKKCGKVVCCKTE